MFTKHVSSPVNPILIRLCLLANPCGHKAVFEAASFSPNENAGLPAHVRQNVSGIFHP
jgi:hypothetical protein